MIRIFIATAALLIAAYSVDRSVIAPWRCSLEKARIKSRTEQIEQSTDSLARLLARQNIDRLRLCIDLAPDDIESLMLLAANLMFLGRNADAADAYRAALRYDHRPELYLSLGLLELEINEDRLALRDLTAACTFNPNLIDEIADPAVRQAVAAAVYGRQKQILMRAGKVQ